MNDVEETEPGIRSQILEDPDVILEDPELMAALLGAGEASGRNVVDLRGKLVDRLEERLDKLEVTNRTVIAAAYENLAGTNQVHRAVLALLGAPDFKGLLKVLNEEVCYILSVDVVRLALESDAVPAGASLGPKGALEGLVIAVPPGGVDAYAGPSGDRPARRVTLRPATPGSDDIYGHGDGWVQSEAVLRLDLGPRARPAMLALGVEDPNRFQPDQGVDLLTFFAGALERILRRWLG